MIDPEEVCNYVTMSGLNKYEKVFRIRNSLESRIKKYWKQIDLCEAEDVSTYAINEVLEEMEELLNGIERIIVYGGDNKSLIRRAVKFLRVPMKERWEDAFGWDIGEDGLEPNLGWKKPESRIGMVMQEKLNRLKLAKIQARKRELLWRLTMELRERWDNYPIFNTLTVKTEYMEEIFERGSKHFINYIKAVTEAIGGKEEDHRYFAVVEQGPKNGRLHLHTIHICRTIPTAWMIDPNKGSRVGDRREINTMKGLWRYGLSAPIAIRSVAGDIWSKLGWAWPKEWDDKAERYVPIKPGSISRMSNYMAKYLHKSYLTKGGNRWRTRMSPRLGLKVLDLMMEKLDMKQLAMITQIKTNTSLTVGGEMIPKGLLIEGATKELLSRLKSMSGTKRYEMLTGIEARSSIIEQSGISIPKTQEYSWPSIGHLATPNSRNLDAFEDVRIQMELDKIVRKYFEPFKTSDSGLIAGNTKVRD